MKKILGLLCAVALSTSLFAQVLDTSGVKNTLSTGFGRGIAKSDSDHSGMVKFNGFTDTFQVRFDLDKFTVEGMLSWNLFKPDVNDNDNLSFGYNGSYVNFLVHPFTGLDIGVGTCLNWDVGHVSRGAQRGLDYGDPGYGKVVGMMPIANVYGDRAIGVRYTFKDLFEAGLTIPDNTDTKDFSFNAAFQINPLDFISASIAYNGIGRSYGELYVGTSLYFENLSFDIYLAGDFRPKGAVVDGVWSGNANNDLFGWGVGATISVPQFNMTIKPELGFTHYMNPNFTFAWYTGLRFDVTLMDMFNLGFWFSYANGADNKNYKDTNGGYVVTVGPEVSWKINKRHSLGLGYNYENKKVPGGNNYDRWSVDFDWTYRY